MRTHVAIKATSDFCMDASCNVFAGFAVAVGAHAFTGYRNLMGRTMTFLANQLAVNTGRKRGSRFMTLYADLVSRKLAEISTPVRRPFEIAVALETLDV
jgi:hypothetical protein